MTVFTVEPERILAGYSIAWRRTLAKFPASLYSLNYLFRHNTSAFARSFVASPDGASSYLVSLTAGDTAPFPDGSYTLTGFITDDATGGDVVKEVVFDGQLRVLPDPLGAKGDLRSHARKMVDLLRSTLEKLAAGTINSASVNGKNYTQKNLAEVRAELARYEEILLNEEQAARIGGDINPNRILIRFTPTC
jgi:hypothetical protein